MGKQCRPRKPTSDVGGPPRGVGWGGGPPWTPTVGASICDAQRRRRRRLREGGWCVAARVAPKKRRAPSFFRPQKTRPTPSSSTRPPRCVQAIWTARSNWIRCSWPHSGARRPTRVGRPRNNSHWQLDAGGNAATAAGGRCRTTANRGRPCWLSATPKPSINPPAQSRTVGLQLDSTR